MAVNLPVASCVTRHEEGKTITAVETRLAGFTLGDGPNACFDSCGIHVERKTRQNKVSWWRHVGVGHRDVGSGDHGTKTRCRIAGEPIEPIGYQEGGDRNWPDYLVLKEVQDDGKDLFPIRGHSRYWRGITSGATQLSA